uniref:Peptidase M12B domain-containing protein n=1 Tax=Branchiostoma floridae TaxID=7739 RepID=C3Y758_BRAFL|eukprot:XP_002607676.1 hypothetical protein BRAFLDRAFT_82878 [Branchiostoma floridae]
MTTCTVHVVADHRFYRVIAGSDAVKAIAEMVLHMEEADRIFRQTDFDEDGNGDNVGFSITAISLYTDEESMGYNLGGHYRKAEDYLGDFSRNDFNDFCLAIAFTYQDFSGVLGLAWLGSSLRRVPGGICQRRVLVMSDWKERSFNTAMVTFDRHGSQMSRAVTIISVVHEFGHGFGSPHDPEECRPGGAQGNYVMYPYATDGRKPNNDDFSVCSKQSMRPVMAIKGTRCFEVHEGPFCGNGILEEGEECDCGTAAECDVLDSCCTPPGGVGFDPQCTFKRHEGKVCRTWDGAYGVLREWSYRESVTFCRYYGVLAIAGFALVVGILRAALKRRIADTARDQQANRLQALTVEAHRQIKLLDEKLRELETDHDNDVTPGETLSLSPELTHAVSRMSALFPTTKRSLLLESIMGCDDEETTVRNLLALGHPMRSQTGYRRDQTDRRVPLRAAPATVPTVGYCFGRPIPTVPTVGYCFGQFIPTVPTVGYCFGQLIPTVPTVGYCFGQLIPTVPTVGYRFGQAPAVTVPTVGYCFGQLIPTVPTLIPTVPTVGYRFGQAPAVTVPTVGYCFGQLIPTVPTVGYRFGQLIPTVPTVGYRFGQLIPTVPTVRYCFGQLIPTVPTVGYRFGQAPAVTVTTVGYLFGQLIPTVPTVGYRFGQLIPTVGYRFGQPTSTVTTVRYRFGQTTATVSTKWYQSPNVRLHFTAR